MLFPGGWNEFLQKCCGLVEMLSAHAVVSFGLFAFGVFVDRSSSKVVSYRLFAFGVVSFGLSASRCLPSVMFAALLSMVVCFRVVCLRSCQAFRDVRLQRHILQSNLFITNQP